MKLGDWLHDQKMTQEAFADEVSADKSTVSRWVSGDVQPRREQMKRIIRITKGAVTANDFMGLPDGDAGGPGGSMALRAVG